jgi:hypothetical protein
LTWDDFDGSRAADALLGKILPRLGLLSSNILPRRGRGGKRSPKENRAFVERIPEAGSGSVLTLFLRNLIIES